MNRFRPTFTPTRGLAFCLVLVSAAWCHAADAGRPNVVLVLADDLTWTDMGCYGNRDVKTPNIDRLASQGMRFTHTFTATAMCAPTRQQLYTGIFPVRNGAYPNHSRVYGGTKSMVHYLRDLGYRVGLHGKRHFGPADSFPFETVRDAKAFMTRDAKQPYCLVYASNSPHLPWSAGDASAYDPTKFTLPPYIADTPETRQALARYYAEVTDLDREVGQLMKAVDASGQADNTAFIFTSEQGSQFPHGKWTCYDTGLRTAFIVRWPERVKAGSVTHAMVQYVDVVPTLVDAAGGEPIKGLDGSSFLPVLLGKATEHRDMVFGAHTTRGIINGSKSYPIRSIRTRTHKLILNLSHETAFQNVAIGGRDRAGYWQSWVELAKTDAKVAKLVHDYQHRPAEEFYDVVNDPYEMNNLADRPEHRAEMDRLRNELKAWMKQQGDEGVATELAANSRQGRGKKKSKQPTKRSEKQSEKKAKPKKSSR